MESVNQYYTATLTDSVIQVQYRQISHISIRDARTIVVDRIRYFQDRQFPVLIKRAKIKSIDKTARDFLFDTQFGLKNIKAIAFIEFSAVDQILLKFIFHQHTPRIPHRTFRNENDALAWLYLYR
ncbi:MAG: hypothetical protein AAF992_05770 [Bacteroidota bacterium]